VADNLSRATAHSPRDSQDAAVSNFIIGVEMTEKELQGAFERNGLKQIDPSKGEKFDPHLHQAVMEQPSDEVAAGGVIQVLQAGYELMGRLVRPAMVAVAAKGSRARTRRPSRRRAPIPTPATATRRAGRSTPRRNRPLTPAKAGTQMEWL
jgi:molecular chaperone GrpE